MDIIQSDREAEGHNSAVETSSKKAAKETEIEY